MAVTIQLDPAAGMSSHDICQQLECNLQEQRPLLSRLQELQDQEHQLRRRLAEAEAADEDNPTIRDVQQVSPSQRTQLPVVEQEDSPPQRPPLSVAPMMAWTDHHFRQLVRLLTRRTLLYTEMYPVDVVLLKAAEDADSPGAAPDRQALRRLLTFDPTQHPIAVQLGGRDPERMGEAARLCASFGYDEVNINCGCPSDTVSGNGYGACLMREAGLVQRLAAAVRAAVPAHVEVTVKHRLGVDDHDSWDELVAFVEAVSAPPARVRRFVVHARTALLGLSTADNRAVPPLRHETVCLPAA